MPTTDVTKAQLDDFSTKVLDTKDGMNFGDVVEAMARNFVGNHIVENSPYDLLDRAKARVISHAQDHGIDIDKTPVQELQQQMIDAVLHEGKNFQPKHKGLGGKIVRSGPVI